MGRNTTTPLKLSVVVPVFNERPTIGEIIRRIQVIAVEKEILIVDDGSTEGTREFLADLAHRCSSEPEVEPTPEGSPETRVDNIRIFFQEKDCGKGGRYRFAT
jgi:glycosyltransferase involved in cell wall biosynthesis